MFSRFTASSRRVMQRAFREAKRCQHDFVGTEHLLFGLLCDRDGPAVRLLKTLQANPELMLEKVELSLQRHFAEQAMEQFPLSPASRRAFRGAAEEAARCQHVLVGPEHLLLGLLWEIDAEANRILSGHGVTLAHARAAVRQLPPDAFHETQLEAGEPPRFRISDNPTTAELERWIAPPLTHEPVKGFAGFGMLWNGGRRAAPMQDVDDIAKQLRLVQLVLGGLAGYAFGEWLGGVGIPAALIGLLIAAFGGTWFKVAIGAACGFWGTLVYHLDEHRLWQPFLMAGLGGILGGLLGHGWRFQRKVPVENPPPKPRESGKIEDAARK